MSDSEDSEIDEIINDIKEKASRPGKSIQEQVEIEREKARAKQEAEEAARQKMKEDDLIREQQEAEQRAIEYEQEQAEKQAKREAKSRELAAQYKREHGNEAPPDYSNDTSDAEAYRLAEEVYPTTQQERQVELVAQAPSKSEARKLVADVSEVDRLQTKGDLKRIKEKIRENKLIKQKKEKEARVTAEKAIKEKAQGEKNEAAYTLIMNRADKLIAKLKSTQSINYNKEVKNLRKELYGISMDLSYPEEERNLAYAKLADIEREEARRAAKSGRKFTPYTKKRPKPGRPGKMGGISKAEMGGFSKTRTGGKVSANAAPHGQVARAQTITSPAAPSPQTQTVSSPLYVRTATTPTPTEPAQKLAEYAVTPDGTKINSMDLIYELYETISQKEYGKPYSEIPIGDKNRVHKIAQETGALQELKKEVNDGYITPQDTLAGKIAYKMKIKRENPSSTIQITPQKVGMSGGFITQGPQNKSKSILTSKRSPSTNIFVTKPAKSTLPLKLSNSSKPKNRILLTNKTTQRTPSVGIILPKPPKSQLLTPAKKGSSTPSIFVSHSKNKVRNIITSSGNFGAGFKITTGREKTKKGKKNKLNTNMIGGFVFPGKKSKGNSPFKF